MKASLKHVVANERGRGLTQLGGQKGTKTSVSEDGKKEKERPRALDLFCGTKSVTRTLEDIGYEVVNLDNRKECQATFTVDIRKWDYKKICKPGEFALIFASIPCTEFSQALTTRERDLKTADSIAKKL